MLITLLLKSNKRGCNREFSVSYTLSKCFSFLVNLRIIIMS